MLVLMQQKSLYFKWWQEVLSSKDQDSDDFFEVHVVKNNYIYGDLNMSKDNLKASTAKSNVTPLFFHLRSSKVDCKEETSQYSLAS